MISQICSETCSETDFLGHKKRATFYCNSMIINALQSGPTWNRTKHLLIMSQLL
jgi:hypothetical protein